MLGRKDPPPEGKDNCLLGLTFVLSGVLESLERETASDLIKKYGGYVIILHSIALDYCCNLTPSHMSLSIVVLQEVYQVEQVIYWLA
jgi:hypothetical protein